MAFISKPFYWERLTHAGIVAVCMMDCVGYHCVVCQLMIASFVQCEKLNRKRSSFVASFVSTHDRTIDDVDKSIMEAR